MPKLILTTEAQGKVAYKFAERSTSRDPARLVVFGIAAVALLTFLASMIAVLVMRAP